MDRAELEAALKTAFIQCEIELCPLDSQQKGILLQVLMEALIISQANETNDAGEETNPLDELTPQQRQTLLAFVEIQEKRGISWKIQLLNDWFNERDSGTVQFIRKDYGLQWLNRVRKVHLAQYFEQQQSGSSLKLKAGDRIEVANDLWEWVQEDGPCSRQWFPCTVVSISEISDGDPCYTNCTIRFENSAEFEIQGIYQWNCYSWRYPT